MFGHFLKLDQALAMGFEPSWLTEFLRVGDTVEMTKYSGGWKGFQKDVVWVTLHTEAEVQEYKLRFEQVRNKPMVVHP